MFAITPAGYSILVLSTATARALNQDLKMDESLTIKETGLGIAMTTIFIAGQMAGGGVLMLPGAMVSTGGSGFLV